MELELRHLRLIVTVAEQGSVTRAAAALGLTQPALTAQLNRIDRTFGAAVFTRDQRGARPTALGEFVLGRAKVLLPAMSALVEDAHRIVAGRDERARFVRVGTAATALGGLFVNRLVSALDAEVTSVTLPDVDGVAAQLAARTLDVALVGMCGNASPPTLGGVRWWRVSTDPVFVLVPDGHPLGQRAVVTLTRPRGRGLARGVRRRVLPAVLRHGVRAGRVHPGQGERGRPGGVRRPGAGGPRGRAGAADVPGHARGRRGARSRARRCSGRTTSGGTTRRRRCPVDGIVDAAVWAPTPRP